MSLVLAAALAVAPLVGGVGATVAPSPTGGLAPPTSVPAGGPDYAAIAGWAQPEPDPVVWILDEPVPVTLDLTVWVRLAACESGGDWHIAGRYRGGLQFWPATWRSLGGVGDAAEAPVAEQIERARLLLDRAGWGQWPFCSKKLGYR